MSRSMKKPPMRLVISVVAVVLVAIAVPFSVAVADGMNAMIGGGEKVIANFDSPEKFEQDISPQPGTLGSARSGVVAYYRFSGTEMPTLVKQSLFTSKETGDKYNQFFYTTTTAPMWNDTHFIVMLDITPKAIIDCGVDTIAMNLSMDKAITLHFPSIAYKQYPSGVEDYRSSSVIFTGVVGTTVKVCSVPFDFSATNAGENVTGRSFTTIPGEWAEMRFSLDTVAVMKAQGYMSDCSNVAMGIMVVRHDSTGPAFVNGDHIMFTVKALSAPVSGYAISNIFVGMLGLSLIVGAVFATPWVGSGIVSGSQHREAKRSSKPKRSKRGRR